ncbi:MAG: HD domain-containing protein, partial [Sedimentisphaerales bacterium]|nr:HD domain-containing protein [Sedimentisphaerales bacterium]
MHLASRFLDSAIDSQKYKRGSRIVSEFVSVCRRDLKLFLGRKRVEDEEVITDVRKIVRSAALCHDLGHFPLSHTLERAFRQEFWTGAIPAYLPTRECHELISVDIVRHILNSNDPVLEKWISRA